MVKKEKHALGSENNPVKCDDFDGMEQYLSKLIGPNGQEVLYERKGSKKGIYGNMVDVYKIYTEDGAVKCDIHIDMYHEGYKEKKVVDGFKTINDFKKRKYFNKVDYLINKEKEILLSFPNFKLPQHYTYIWSKAGLLVLMGPYIYAKNDFFGLPYAFFDTQQIVSASNQIVHQLNGAIKEKPIIVSNHETAVDLLATFHFSEVETIKIDNNLYSILFHHNVKTSDEIKLYFNFENDECDF
jgi:hypothetical protein